MMERITLEARDGYKLDIHLWEVKNAKAVVQIIHGMEEHQERYDDFVKFLNACGLSVVTSDMRGHGYTAPTLGFFKEKEGYLELIEDQRIIRAFIGGRYETLSVYLFAHSFGTVISRVLLQQESRQYEKVVLSGYPNYQSGAHAGILLARLISLVHGPEYKSKFLQNLSVGVFNNQIKNPETKVDWISRNKQNVRKYIEDPYCGFGFTCSAFNDLYHLVIRMHDYRRYENLNANLKILMLRGEEDPCVGGEKGSADSVDVLIKAGFSDIHEISYPHMRHEILAEDDKEKVYEDIVRFYESV